MSAEKDLIGLLMKATGCRMELARQVARAALLAAKDPPRCVDGSHSNVSWPTRCFSMAMRIIELEGRHA